MLRTVKPRNARSKRALEAREPKEVEDVKKVLFIKGSHAGEILGEVIKELHALKRPNSIILSKKKKNAVLPFEDPTFIEEQASRNDASIIVLGQSTKKRPNSLTFIRTFDAKVLDMCEVVVDKFVSMNEYKTPKSTPGHRPLMHFASELFDTHPRYVQLKSLLLDFFVGQSIEAIHLKGIEHIISVSVAPAPISVNTAGQSLSSIAQNSEKEAERLPIVHIRTYTLKLLATGTRIPRVELVPMGPSIDMSLRRHTPADPDLWAAAMKRPKMKKQDIEKGIGKRKRNIDVDDMGDVRGRVHLGKQDLSKLQTKKMKGLKGREDDEDDDSVSGSDMEMHSTPKKRRKTR